MWGKASFTVFALLTPFCIAVIAVTSSAACSTEEPAGVADAGHAPDDAVAAGDTAPVEMDSGLPEAPMPFPDTGPPDTGICLPECAAAGGTCLSGSCIFACTGASTCAGKTCPAGMPCVFNCSGASSCAHDILCKHGSSCQINCTGFGACTGKIQCSGPDCTVSCDGPSSCTGNISCAAGTGVCNVKCGGSDSCGGQLSCDGYTCDVACTGVTACKSGVCCTASKCNVTPGHSSC